MEEFYSAQELISNGKKDKTRSNLESKFVEDWKNAVSNTASKGQFPEDTAVLLHNQPSRQILDSLSTQKHCLVAHYQKAIPPKFYESMDEYTPESYTVKLQRTGIMGIWDTMWDASK